MHNKRIVPLAAFCGVYAGHRRFVKSICTKAIDCFRRKSDQPAASDYIGAKFKVLAFVPIEYYCFH
jgi:hypothetical protein